MFFRYKGEEVMIVAEIGASSYRRFLQGDQTALAEFISQYSDALVRFAYSFVRNAAVAEDVAAEAMAILYMKSIKFPDEKRMRAYLYKTARNKAMDYLRRHKHEVPLDDVENVLGSGGPEKDTIRRERDEAVYQCLQKLPEDYRQVLHLAYLEGFSIPDVCKVMNKYPKQVYNLLSRARSALKQELQKEGITSEDL